SPYATAKAVTVAAAWPVEVPKSAASRGSMGSQMRNALALTKAASASSAMARFCELPVGVGMSVRQVVARRHAARRDHLPARAQFAQRQALVVGLFHAVAVLVDGVGRIDGFAVRARGLQGKNALGQLPATCLAQAGADALADLELGGVGHGAIGGQGVQRAELARHAARPGVRLPGSDHA